MNNRGRFVSEFMLGTPTRGSSSFAQKKSEQVPAPGELQCVLFDRSDFEAGKLPPEPFKVLIVHSAPFGRRFSNRHRNT